MSRKIVHNCPIGHFELLFWIYNNDYTVCIKHQLQNTKKFSLVATYNIITISALAVKEYLELIPQCHIVNSQPTPRCKAISCVSFCLAAGLMQRRRCSWPFLRFFCFAVVGKQFCLLVLRFFRSLPSLFLSYFSV